MNRTHFLQWLNQIYAATEAEIDCDRLQALLPAYVDFEVAGDDPGSRLPQAKAHLTQCPDCADVYAGLHAVAELEAQGRLPQVEESLAQFEAEPTPEPKETVPA